MVDFAVNVKGDEIVAQMLAKFEKGAPTALRQAILREANDLRGKMVRGIRDQAPGGKTFSPLAETTIRMKRGKSKALINYGDLIRSINVTEVGDLRQGGAAFVGVHRTARPYGKAGAARSKALGKALVNIAAIHEFGARPFVIPVTPRLRRFWFAMFKKGVFKAPLKASRTTINHPGIKARPFVRPTFAAWRVGLAERIAARLLEALLKGNAASAAREATASEGEGAA
jgi:hypothetical protein